MNKIKVYDTRLHGKEAVIEYLKDQGGIDVGCGRDEDYPYAFIDEDGNINGHFLITSDMQLCKSLQPPKKKVIIESPYAGDVERNVTYARACLRDSLLRGEAPMASHLLYTQEGVLDDLIPEERELGISTGLEWLESADLHVFYTDYGLSKGMNYALEKSQEIGRKIEFRTLYEK